MCDYCKQLRSELDDRDVAYEAVDIWEDRSQAEVVTAVTGGDEIVPTVRVGERFFVNPSVDEVLAAVSGSA
jgi:glutaredoxin